MSAESPFSYTPDVEAIRRDVTWLASMSRGSARAGERESASALAGRMAEIGLSDVAVESYRYQPTYALAHGMHNAMGMATAMLGGRLGALLGAGTLASYEREVSGRSQWLRRLLPAGEGANVVGRVPSAGEARARLVLVAHHDAANTGAIWNPRVATAAGARHVRRRRVDPFMAPLELAFAAIVSGCLLPRRTRAGRWMRALGGLTLAIGCAVDADVARSETVPGASDNATGVAACLDLARALAASPLRHVEVVVLLPGSEEAGMGGMGAFLDSRAGSLDPERTFVLGLDTLGAGTPIVCRGEGAMREQRYRDADVALVERGADCAGLARPQQWRIGAWTDPIMARHRGLKAASLLSMGPGYFPNYHHPSDTAERVDWRSVSECAALAGGTVQAYAAQIEIEGS